jgi:uncharacterized membrane protein YeaQ/YmgE (transglycosylase-associated protein family)
MHLIIALIVGGIVGWLASLFMKTNSQMGIIFNVVVGIVGSSLGRWLASEIGLAAYGPIASLIVSVLGAMLLILILKGLRLLK